MIDSGIFQLIVELAGINALSEFFASLSDLNQAAMNTLSIVGVFTLIFGVLQCFFGYKLIKLWCGFVGFLLGCLAGVVIASAVVGSGVETPEFIILLIIFSLGLLGGLLAYRAYIVGVFLYAFTAAFLVGFSLVSLIFNSVRIGLITGLLLGIAMGVVSVMYRRFWIIIATSISGGISAGAGFMMIIQSNDPILSLIIPVVFIVAGFFIQHKTVKKEVAPAAGQAAPLYVVANTSPPPASAVYPPVQPQYTPAGQTPIVPAETQYAPVMQTPVPTAEQSYAPVVDPYAPAVDPHAPSGDSYAPAGSNTPIDPMYAPVEPPGPPAEPPIPPEVILDPPAEQPGSPDS